MFRTAVLRAARLSRVATVSKAGVIGLRPVIRASGASRISSMGMASPVLSQLMAQGRFYSSDASEATQTDESTETAQESEPEKASGLITRFADLESLGVHTNVVRSLTETLGYETMTPVQSATIGPALSGKDIVAQAKTGTGKTLAFLVPVIQKMITENPNLAYPRRIRAKANDILAVILSPTRELAEQIGEEARKLCRGTGVIVQTAVGGTRKREMLMRTRQQGCHLMIATPGRLNDILSDEMSGIDAPRLCALVLDEADRMLDVGFDQELREIVRHLPNRSEQPRQTLLFSATLPKNVISLARTYVDPTNFQFVQTIDVNDAPTHEKVPQHIVEVKGYENIYPTVLELFKREIQAAKEAGAEGKPFKAIVFLPTTNFVQLTAVAFRQLARSNPDLPYLYHIHSKLTQSARTAAADMFRQAKSGILFSSDVTARGMDFPNVTHVIQVGVPPDREQYIHRLGRTGRADKGGEGWIIIPRDEMRSARNVLVDLPIKRVDALESATHDLSTAEADAALPEMFSHVSNAMKRVPAGLLEDTYMSFFGGQSMGRNLQTTLDNLNEWVRLGWGWEQPPAIDHGLARKRGLLKLRGIRLDDGSEPRRERDEGRNGRDGRRDGRREERLDNADPFESAFKTDLGDNSFSRSGNGFSRDGGNGFSRDGGNGFSRDGGNGFSRGGGGGGYSRGGGGGGGFSRGSGGGGGFSRGGGGDRGGFSRGGGSGRFNNNGRGRTGGGGRGRSNGFSRDGGRERPERSQASF